MNQIEINQLIGKCSMNELNFNLLESLAFRGNKLTPIIHTETQEPWFLGKEVAEILGIGNLSQAIKAAELEEDEKGIILNDTLGGEQKMTILSESGLYGLIGNTRKQIGKDLRRFVRKKVLPSIRKTGGYNISQDPQEQALILARNLIQMSGQVKALEARNEVITEQRDKAIKEKAYVSAGREGTLLSRLGKLASLEEVVNIVRLSCEDVDNNEYLKPTELAKDIKLNLEVKKLPLCINELLCEMGLQELAQQQVKKKIKGKNITFNIKYLITAEGEGLCTYKHTGIISRKTEITTSINWSPKVIKMAVDYLNEAAFS
jgi:prophage antirepressor-like protein